MGPKGVTGEGGRTPAAAKALYRFAFKRQLFADAGFTVKLQIPLNPPLKKGDFKEAAVFSPPL